MVKLTINNRSKAILVICVIAIGIGAISKIFIRYQSGDCSEVHIN